MTIKFELPETFSVTIAKTGRVITLDMARVPVGSVEDAIQYGLDQKFGDCSASVTRGGKSPFKGSDAEFEAAVHTETDDVEARFYAGTWGVRASRKIDPRKVAIAEMGRMLGRNLTEAEFDVIVNGASKMLKSKAA